MKEDTLQHKNPRKIAGKRISKEENPLLDRPIIMILFTTAEITCMKKKLTVIFESTHKRRKRVVTSF